MPVVVLGEEVDPAAEVADVAPARVSLSSQPACDSWIQRPLQGIGAGSPPSGRFSAAGLASRAGRWYPPDRLSATSPAPWNRDRAHGVSQMSELGVDRRVWISVVPPSQKLNQRPAIPLAFYVLDSFAVAVLKAQLLDKRRPLRQTILPDLSVLVPRCKFRVACRPRIGRCTLLSASAAGSSPAGAYSRPARRSPRNPSPRTPDRRKGRSHTRESCTACGARCLHPWCSCRR